MSDDPRIDRMQAMIKVLISRVNKLETGGALPTLTSGSVVFSGGGTTLSQDNANFYWNDTTNTLGIDTAPNANVLGMHILATAAPGNSAHLLMERIDTSAAAFGQIQMKARGSPGSETAVLTNDVIANWVARGWDGSAGQYANYNTNSAVIRVVATEDYSSTAHGCRFEIRTATKGSTTVATRMTIGDTATSILNIQGLPTSAAGLASGDVWNNLGVLTIV